MRSALGLLLRAPTRPASLTHNNAAPCASMAAHDRGARTAMSGPSACFSTKLPCRRGARGRREEKRAKKSRSGQPLDRPHLGVSKGEGRVRLPYSLPGLTRAVRRDPTPRPRPRLPHCSPCGWARAGPPAPLQAGRQGRARAAAARVRC